jgi:hypothetical protein
MECGIPMGETIKMPELLPYPEIMSFSDVPMLHNQYVYIVEKYPFEGFSILVVRDNDYIAVRVADFQGNLIDPTSNDQIGMILNYSISVIKHIGLNQCILYLSNIEGVLTLVDVRLSYNKFSGPGFMQELFTKIPIQKVVKVIQINEELKGKLINGEEPWDGEFIIKPSAFKFITRAEDDIIPMYGKIER